MTNFSDDVKMIASLIEEGEGYEVRAGIGLLTAIHSGGNIRLYHMKSLDADHRAAALRIIETYAASSIVNLDGVLSSDELDRIEQRRLSIIEDDGPGYPSF